MTSYFTMRSAFFLLLITLADSNAFHLNRVDSYSVNGSRNIARVLKYQDSHLLDLQEGETLFTGLDSRNTFDTEQKLNNRHSASEWFYNLKTWRHSSVLNEIRNPVIALGSWATVVSLVFKALHSTGRSKLALHMSIPHAAHSFLVSSIGLLLVFRTNSAYQRFLEGRKIWEQVSSKSRNLSRFVTMYREEVGTDRRQRILHLLAAFPYLLRHQVRNGCLCSDGAASIDERNKLCLLEPNRPEQHCFVDRRKFPWSLLERAQAKNSQNILHKIAQVTNRPLWICDRIGQEIMEIPIGPNFSSRERLKLLGDVDQLANAVGSCERIHQTTVPLHYARHALRSLTVWLVTLPFSLVKDFGLLTGPVTGMIAWLLFGVYQIGHSIEDPFQGSLRLSTLCEDIRRDILEDREARESAFDSSGNDGDLLGEFDVLSHKIFYAPPLSDLVKTEKTIGRAQEEPLGLQ